jgi:zinc/manganese transport system substrate-binding protein
VIAALALAISIVAAENFYGDVAAQIGGRHVQVTSILRNPDQDPHLFEATPSVARGISRAQIVVENGLGYDPWVDKLLSATPSMQRTSIVVGTLAGKKPGDNPHIWYDPATMIVYARALTDDLIRRDPADRGDYQHALAQFLQSMRTIDARIASMRQRLAGTPVAATEPVFGYMLDRLGMRVLDTRFQVAIMNNTEPGAVEVAQFESDLTQHRARLLIYNAQVSDSVSQRMRALAQRSQVPVVGVTETEPPDTPYQRWILSQLDAVDRALR